MAYCDWPGADERMRRYHDEEWGLPVHDDARQFEYLLMESMQAGLSWDLMMRKREIFRACFAGFDFGKVARFTEGDILRILSYPGMIRSRRKIEAVIANAKGFLAIREEFGTFDAYLWSFTAGKTVIYNKHPEGWIPVSNALSERISKDLKKRGFSFVGPVTLYSHLQACGIILDHSRDCPRFSFITSHFPCVEKRREGEKGVVHY